MSLGFKSQAWAILLAAGMATAHAAPPAASAREYVFTGEKKIRFISLEKGRLVLSQDCVDAKTAKPRDCEAYRATRKASVARLEADRSLKGSVSPGSRICSEQVGGEVELAFDDQGNETAFCRFSDQSRIDLGSLAFYGRSR